LRRIRRGFPAQSCGAAGSLPGRANAIKGKRSLAFPLTVVDHDPAADVKETHRALRR